MQSSRSFGEPYAPSSDKTFLKPTYFPEGNGLWARNGLVGCQAVADSLRLKGHYFTVLDVAQLLKHMLGLAHGGKPWHLCCLWFEVPGVMANRHRAELKAFSERLGDDGAHFSAFTYQELFARMLPLVGPADGRYIEYLRERYIGTASKVDVRS